MIKKSFLFFSLFSLFSLLFAEDLVFEKEWNEGNLKIPLRNYAVFAPASFSLYAIGFYVDGTETDNIKLKNADKPMTIQLTSLYKYLKMRTLMKEFKRGFSYAADHDEAFLATIQKRIDRFLNILRNSKKKLAKYSRITFSYLPNEGTHIYFNSDYLGTIRGVDFKRALFGIWLNDNCANDKLRDAIIRLEPQKRGKYDGQKQQ